MLSKLKHPDLDEARLGEEVCSWGFVDPFFQHGDWRDWGAILTAPEVTTWMGARLKAAFMWRLLAGGMMPLLSGGKFLSLKARKAELRQSTLDH